MNRELEARFAGLGTRAPSVPLARLPTRVHRLDAISRDTGAGVWIKRDDETHPELGGSKIRALEFFLAEAKGWRRPFVAYGPEASGWLLGLARFGLPLGLDFRMLTFPQPRTEASCHKAELLRRAAGPRLTRARDGAEFALRALHAGIRIAGGGWEPGPPGGSSAQSTVGYVNAAVELAAQVSRGECPAPDIIVVPLGSGGLAAGLTLGLAAAEMSCELQAVSIAPRIVSNTGRVIRLLLQTAWVLDWKRPRMANVRVTHKYRGTYALPTAEGERATRLFAEKEGVQLDPCYSSKAAAAALDLARANPGKHILLWHTYARPS